MSKPTLTTPAEREREAAMERRPDLAWFRLHRGLGHRADVTLCREPVCREAFRAVVAYLNAQPKAREREEQDGGPGAV